MHGVQMSIIAINIVIFSANNISNNAFERHAMNIESETSPVAMRVAGRGFTKGRSHCERARMRRKMSMQPSGNRSRGVGM